MNPKPNIVLILTDDQGAWALGCAGNTDIKTPNLDALAASGCRFENFFCTSPVCSPARASILTGRIPSSHGVQDWIRSGNLNRDGLGEKAEDPYYRSEKKAVSYLDGQLTYTDILKENGYRLALSGKWHLGDSLRPQHGFDQWFTIGRGGCLYNKADVVEHGTLRYETRYITDVITEKAISFLTEFAAEPDPFYLSVHYTAPHDPWDESQHPHEYVELYRNCEFRAVPDLPLHPWQTKSAPYGTGETRKALLRGYYAAITAMDANVGRLLDALKELNLYENTVIFFMSDNGMNMGHHGIWGKGNGTFPFNMYDTAVKVPFIASWPNRIKPGVVCKQLCSQYDFIHTLLDLADIRADLPGDLPGTSFYPALKDANAEGGSVVVFDEYGPTRMIRTKDWKYIHRCPYGPDELYYLAEDPDESDNLIDKEEYSSVADGLYRQLAGWFAKYADPAVDASREGVTGSGQLTRPGIYAEVRKVFYDKLPFASGDPE